MTDKAGTAMVFKALPIPSWGPRWAQAAQLVDRLRLAGYPAPRYFGTGATDEYVWSLQELLPGHVPVTPSPTHVKQLVDLASRHAGMAEPDASWLPGRLESIQRCCDALAEYEPTARLADTLRLLLERHSAVEALDNGIVHGDFHHRNYLASGDDVVGVFDWEGARCGDWRSDLANLVVVVDDPAATGALQRAATPELAAIFVALHVSRYLEYDSRIRPEQLADKAERTIARLAPWWEAVL
ncbi:MAG: phosphotransferase [Actinobacteria bacterium]|nr:phosphotransferase [Actinomycetota bacterium]